jgi:hypothetical protein
MVVMTYYNIYIYRHSKDDLWVICTISRSSGIISTSWLPYASLISFPEFQCGRSRCKRTSRMPHWQASSMVDLFTGALPAKRYHYLPVPAAPAWFFGVQLLGPALVAAQLRSLVMACNGQQSNDGVRVVDLEPSFDTGQSDQSLIIRETCLHGVATDVIITVSILLLPRLWRQSISDHDYR